VDQIASLTLLQAADLVSALKEKLNIVELASAPSSAAAPAAAAAVVEEVVVVKEKTVFNVTLTKIDATAKAKAIREVKAIIPGMNLVEVRGSFSCFALVGLFDCWCTPVERKGGVVGTECFF
jgi:large subunit ribosomal protein L7/L12